MAYVDNPNAKWHRLARADKTMKNQLKATKKQIKPTGSALVETSETKAPTPTPATNYGMTGFGFAVNEGSVYSNNLIVGSQKLALFRVINKQGDDNILTQSELEDALGNQEFLDFVAELHIDLKQTKDTADSARRVFACLDKNDSGDITMNEFLQGLEKLGRGVISVQASKESLAASAAKLRQKAVRVLTRKLGRDPSEKEIAKKVKRLTDKADKETRRLSTSSLQGFGPGLDEDETASVGRDALENSFYEGNAPTDGGQGKHAKQRSTCAKD